MTRTLQALARRSDVRIAAVFLLTLVVMVSVTGRGASALLEMTAAEAAAGGLIAIGLMLVVVQGEIDLSVGSVLALSGAVTIGLSDHGLVVAVIAAIAVSIVVGLLNGVLVTMLGINSFVATLATMIIVRGATHVATGGKPLSGDLLDPSVWMTTPLFGSWLTPRVGLVILCAVAAGVFIGYSRVGRDFLAVGGNRHAAIASGIPVRRRMLLAFVLASAAAGVAGAALSIELNTASPVVGDDAALTAIAAVVIGGTSLQGGRGTVLGTALGVLTLAVITVGMRSEDVPSSYQSILIGSILIAVIVLDAMSFQRRLGLRAFLGRAARRDRGAPPAQGDPATT